MSGIRSRRFWTVPVSAAVLFVAGPTAWDAVAAGTVLGLGGMASDPGPTALRPAAGTITGHVQLDARPPRRAARRYSATAPAQTVQPLPVVVYLKGRIPGADGLPARPDSRMVQRDSAFVPGALVVPVGTTVDFPNEDSFFHNVFSYSSAKRFDLGRYPRGESRSVTFDRPGVVRIFCEVHEHMRAAVVVSENPFHQVLDDDGRFTLAGVPPGRHTVVAWHVDLGEEEAVVEVREGGTATLFLVLAGGP